MSSELVNSIIKAVLSWAVAIPVIIICIIRPAKKRKAIERNAKANCDYIAQHYNGEAVISADTRSGLIPYSSVLLSITNDKLCIIDRGNLENHTDIPLKNILWYQLDRTDNFPLKTSTHREIERYCSSLTAIDFEVNIDGKNKDIRFPFVLSDNRPFNIYSLKRCDFFKLLDERVPKRKIENTLE